MKRGENGIKVVTSTLLARDSRRSWDWLREVRP